jgi:hypothetical protein
MQESQPIQVNRIITKLIYAHQSYSLMKQPDEVMR